MRSDSADGAKATCCPLAGHSKRMSGDMLIPRVQSSRYSFRDTLIDASRRRARPYCQFRGFNIAMSACAQRPLAVSKASSAAAPPSYLTCLLSGGFAGMVVDVALFPLDTLKTRLQAPEGFRKAGGFSNIYRGLLSAFVGSAPGAAIFFASYEASKSALPFDRTSPMNELTAAGIAECMACFVRVPTENVKQKMQTGRFSSTSEALYSVAAEGGGLGRLSGFYRGYFTTCLREVPFSFIQFPIWEGIKRACERHQGYEATVLQSALAGSFSGAIAGALTTPLDVVKTRLMLKVDKNGVEYRGLANTVQRIVVEEGATALLNGIVPRVFWISLGGAFFLGGYQAAERKLRGWTG